MNKKTLTILYFIEQKTKEILCCVWGMFLFVLAMICSISIIVFGMASLTSVLLDAIGGLQGVLYWPMFIQACCHFVGYYLWALIGWVFVGNTIYTCKVLRKDLTEWIRENWTRATDRAEKKMVK